MKTAGIVCLIWFVVCVGFAASTSKEEIIRWKTAAATAFCKVVDNDDMLNDITQCENKFNPEVEEVFLACQNEAYPNEPNSFSGFVKGGCKDNAVFQMYFDCLGPSLDDEKFREGVQNSKDALNCFVDAAKKYDVYSDELILRDD